MSAVDVLAHEYGWSDQKILDLTIAKIRVLLEASQVRRKGEFRKQIALQEWSTRLLAQVSIASAGGSESDQKRVAKESFPWYDDQEEAAAAQADPDDLSFLETGDTAAVSKNEGKALPSFAR